MTQSGKPAAAEPIIELVEVIHLRYLLLAALLGLAVGIALLYVYGHSQEQEGIGDGSES